MIRKIIIVILLILIFLPSVLIIVKRSSNFFAPDYWVRYPALKELYYSSQYMIKKNPVIITDEALEAFAAGAFYNGLNPILIVHDQPPLGRYITASSIHIFKNESTITLLLFSVSLMGIYLTGKKVLGNTLYALIPVAIFANEPLMSNKLVYAPLLETTQLPFIIFSLYFFILFTERKKINWAIVSILCLGCIISIRFFVLGFVLFSSQVLFLLIKKRLNDLLKFLVVSPLAVVVLFASYTKSILENGNILAPLGIQKYILLYHQSKFIQLFTVWDLLFFNKWHTWWGNRIVISDPNWLIIWPISFVLSVLLMLLGLFKKIKVSDSEIILFIWVIMYLVMLSSGFASTRYFLPFLPFLYIISLSFIVKVAKIYIKKRK